MEEDFSALETALEVANDVFGVKYSKDYKKLVDAKAYAGKHYAIDDRVEIICDGAFKDCDNLEEIVMPKNLKNIGDEADKICEWCFPLLFNNFKFTIKFTHNTLCITGRIIFSFKTVLNGILTRLRGSFHKFYRSS